MIANAGKMPRKGKAHSLPVVDNEGNFELIKEIIQVLTVLNIYTIYNSSKYIHYKYTCTQFHKIQSTRHKDTD